MSFIQNQIWTADPSDIWTPKTSFFFNDPFAIVMGVQADGSVIADGLLFDAIFREGNPSGDPYNLSWWTFDGNNVLSMPSVDTVWSNGAFEWGTNFAIWFSWGQYSGSVSQIGGPDQDNGVFFSEGTISVQGSNLSAYSGRFWYKVRPSP